MPEQRPIVLRIQPIEVGGPVANQHRAGHREGQRDDEVEPERNATGGLKKVVEHAEQRLPSAADARARASTDQPRCGAVPCLIDSLTLEPPPGCSLSCTSSSSKGIIDSNRPEIVTNSRRARACSHCRATSGNLPTRHMVTEDGSHLRRGGDDHRQALSNVVLGGRATRMPEGAVTSGIQRTITVTSRGL